MEDASGTNFTPVAGLNTLSGANYIYAGDAVVHGDIVLQDAQLFVNGDFTVNGSITGRGSVFVQGNTNLWGATEVNVAEGHVSLYSKGHVTLKGFNGTAFLEANVGGRDLDLVKVGVKGIVEEISANRWDGSPPAWREGPGLNYLEVYRILIGQDVTPSAYNGLIAANYFDVLEDPTRNFGILNPSVDLTKADSGAAYRVLDALSPFTADLNLEEARTATFLTKKLEMLRDLTEGRPVNAPTVHPDLATYVTTGEPYSGILDDIQDASGSASDQAVQMMEGEMRNFTFDALGTSYFKGVVYTNGAFYSLNEVNILGGVYVEKTRFSPEYPLATSGGDLQAGDVKLENGTRITYVEALLEQSPTNSWNSHVVPVYWSSPSS